MAPDIVPCRPSSAALREQEHDREAVAGCRRSTALALGAAPIARGWTAGPAPVPAPVPVVCAPTCPRSALRLLRAWRSRRDRVARTVRVGQGHSCLPVA